MGEVCKSASTLSRQKANQIVKTLLDRYERSVKDAPEGNTLWDLYDRDRLEPKESYAAVYRQAREELASLGVEWRTWH